MKTQQTQQTHQQTQQTQLTEAKVRQHMLMADNYVGTPESKAREFTEKAEQTCKDLNDLAEARETISAYEVLMEDKDRQIDELKAKLEDAYENFYIQCKEIRQLQERIAVLENDHKLTGHPVDRMFEHD